MQQFMMSGASLQGTYRHLTSLTPTGAVLCHHLVIRFLATRSITLRHLTLAKLTLTFVEHNPG
jgi:hypothetical protein